MLRNDVKGVDWLLAHGAYVNVRDDKRNTPLHFAVQEKNIAIVLCLIINDANTRARNASLQKVRHGLGSAAPNSIEAKILGILIAVRIFVVFFRKICSIFFNSSLAPIDVFKVWRTATLAACSMAITRV